VKSSSGPKFTVQRGKPLPPAKGWRITRYPFATMAIGDSFFVAADQLPASGPAVLRVAARGRGMRAAVRTEGDGFRCWRIA
jgi:hypothetical protein